jgi:hypothetical protein
MATVVKEAFVDILGLDHKNAAEKIIVKVVNDSRSNDNCGSYVLKVLAEGPIAFNDMMLDEVKEWLKGRAVKKELQHGSLDRINLSFGTHCILDVWKR